MKKKYKKLSLSTETLVHLNDSKLREAVGGTVANSGCTAACSECTMGCTACTNACSVCIVCP